MRSVPHLAGSLSPCLISFCSSCLLLLRVSSAPVLFLYVSLIAPVVTGMSQQCSASNYCVVWTCSASEQRIRWLKDNSKQTFCCCFQLLKGEALLLFFGLWSFVWTFSTLDDSPLMKLILHELFWGFFVSPGKRIIRLTCLKLPAFSLCAANFFFHSCTRLQPLPGETL